MVAVPTVKSFCGCCDLKVPCIVLAALRFSLFVVFFIAIILYFLIFGFIFYNGSDDIKTERLGIMVALVFIWPILVLPIILINIIFSYWFIRGAVSVRNITTFISKQNQEWHLKENNFCRKIPIEWSTTFTWKRSVFVCWRSRYSLCSAWLTYCALRSIVMLQYAPTPSIRNR